MPALVGPIASLELDGKQGARALRFQRAAATTGRITDPARIDASLDTIRYILEHGGAAVLCSHLGRPKERDARAEPQAGRRVPERRRSGRRSRSRPTVSASITGRLVACAEAGRRAAAREPALSSTKKRPTIAISPTNSRAAKTSTSTTRSAPRIARTPRPSASRAFSSERAAGFLMMRELEALSALTRKPGASIRRDSRRRQGVRQDWRHPQPDDQGRRDSDRRRDGLHVPARARSRRSAARGSKRTSSSSRAS